MSNVPYYFHDSIKGYQLGHEYVVDGMMKHELWDVYNDIGMGVCADLCVDNHNISRE